MLDIVQQCKGLLEISQISFETAKFHNLQACKKTPEQLNQTLRKGDRKKAAVLIGTHLAIALWCVGS